MFTFIIFLYGISVCFAGYSGSFANGVDGTGQGYGFSGSVQYGQPGQSVGQAPNLPIFDFNSFLSGYLNSLRKYHEQFANNANAYAITSNDPDTNVKAEASIIFAPKPKYENYSSIHQNVVSGYGYPEGFAGAGSGGGFSGGFGGAFFPGVASFNGIVPPVGGHGNGGAVASGSVGPGGTYQTAAVYPENANAPNIVNRFSEAAGTPGKPNSFYGVFTSSHSSSTDVDGKKTSVHEAQTTVNDNGKITTYKVKNP